MAGGLGTAGGCHPIFGGGAPTGGATGGITAPPGGCIGGTAGVGGNGACAADPGNSRREKSFVNSPPPGFAGAGTDGCIGGGAFCGGLALPKLARPAFNGVAACGL